jgi:hypothetical protein
MTDLPLSVSGMDEPLNIGFQVCADERWPATRVVIGHPLPALLRGLESLVCATEGVRVAGVARRLDAFIACCAQVGEGIALVDLGLRRLGSRDLVRHPESVPTGRGAASPLNH